MSEELIVGIIRDTSNPEIAARLLADLGELAATDPGLSRVEIILLENPSGEQPPPGARRHHAAGLAVHWVERPPVECDTARTWAGIAELTPGRLPIATARTLVQRRAFERAAASCAAVWILDEDLRLLPLIEAVRRGEPPLSERVRKLRADRVDVAVGPTPGAPPLPARSTVRVNLEDVARHLDLIASLDPEAAWPDRSAENARVRRALPEYYYDLSRAHEDAGAHPMWIEPAFDGETVQAAFARLARAAGGLLEGAPVTREIPESPALYTDQSPLARGGNTLVLRPALLARIPNVAPHIGGRVCRRSDMLWARLAVALEGARFTRAPIPALHDRSGPGRSSFDSDKLLDDARGSAVVAALDVLLAEGAFAGRRPLSRSAVTQAGLTYVARARERFASIQRSEDRVRALLDRILSRLRAPAPRGGLHPAHRAAIEQLVEHAAQLRLAYTARIEAGDPAAEQAEIEQFFLDLPDRVEAYRAGAPRGIDRLHVSAASP